MFKKKSKKLNYIEIIFVCLLLSALILFFELPKFLFVVIGFGIVINVIYVEIMKK